MVQLVYLPGFIDHIESCTYSSTTMYVLTYGKITVDMLTMVFVWNLFLKMSLLLMSIIFLIVSNFTMLILRENQQLWRSLKLFQHQKMLLKIHVRRFVHEHTRLVAYVLRCSGAFQSTLGVLALTNVPMHAFLISYVYYRKLNDTFDIIVVLGLAFLTLFATVSMLPLLHLCELLHWSSRHHIDLQHRLKVNRYDRHRVLHLKWKLLSHYEIVNNHNNIAFRFGVFGVATKKNLFEFTFIYFVYLIFSAKLILQIKLI